MSFVEQAHEFANHIVDAPLVAQHITPAFNFGLAFRLKHAQCFLQLVVDDKLAAVDSIAAQEFPDLL
jgi:hypothetical protein